MAHSLKKKYLTDGGGLSVWTHLLQRTDQERERDVLFSLYIQIWWFRLSLVSSPSSPSSISPRPSDRNAQCSSDESTTIPKSPLPPPPPVQSWLKGLLDWGGGILEAAQTRRIWVSLNGKGRLNKDEFRRPLQGGWKSRGTLIHFRPMPSLDKCDWEHKLSNKSAYTTLYNTNE